MGPRRRHHVWLDIPSRVEFDVGPRVRLAQPITQGLGIGIEQLRDFLGFHAPTLAVALDARTGYGVAPHATMNA